MKNIIENNKLIAEFMGAVCEMVDHTEGNEDYCEREEIDKWLIPTWSKPEGYNENKWGWGKYRMGYFEYHESWDWLIPVVEKCLIGEAEQPLQARILINKIYEALCNTNVKDTHKEVIEFIKWHNEQNK